MEVIKQIQNNDSVEGLGILGHTKLADIQSSLYHVNITKTYNYLVEFIDFYNKINKYKK